HPRLVGRRDGYQGTASRCVVAAAVAGHLVSATRAALSRYAKLSGRDLYLRRIRASGGRRGSPRADDDHGYVPRGKRPSESPTDGQGSAGEIPGRSRDSHKSRAVARRERTDGGGGQDFENATPRRCGRPRDVFEHRASVRARAALQGSRGGGSRRGSTARAGARERNGVVSARRDL